MNGRMNRRNTLALIATLSVSGITLTACSDDGNQAQAQDQTQAPASGATPPATDAKPAASVAPPASQGSVDMAKLLQPGALPEMQLGRDDAPVTIVEYASMTCGHCGAFHRDTLPAIKQKYIDAGKARLILREFPFDPRAEAGFMLARCSGDKYFPMVDVLFKQQEQWVPVQDAQSALLQLAKLGGFTQESFETCLTDQKLLDEVRAVRARGADEFSVEATPTFFINGQKYSGALSVDEMSAVIDSML